MESEEGGAIYLAGGQEGIRQAARIINVMADECEKKGQVMGPEELRKTAEVIMDYAAQGKIFGKGQA